jgi:hypothetical protein
VAVKVPGEANPGIAYTATSPAGPSHLGGKTMMLYKTTIVIWSEYDPRKIELDELARDATHGNAYCSSWVSDPIDNPSADPDWDNNDFFGDWQENTP